MSHVRKLVAFGNYKLENVSLGKGTFGRVELARHALVGTQVALKLFNIEDLKEPYMKNNLHREAKILSAINHENIIRLVEICSSKDMYCLVLEYVPGSVTLQEVVNSKGALGEKVVQGLARQLVSALAYLHSKKIIHRDLKLENILVTPDLNHCVIIDFGLSNFWCPSMKTRCGSIEYAAPELYRKENYGPNVDMWSLGVVVYGLTLGHLPFELNRQTTVPQLVPKILQGLSMEHISEMKSGLSLDCSAFLLKLLDVKPGTRLSSLEALSDRWIAASQCEGRQEPRASLECLLQVAEEIRMRFGLKIHPREVLAHVQNRPYGSTGGCFNLLTMQKMAPIRKAQTQEKQDGPIPPKAGPVIASRQWRRLPGNQAEPPRLQRIENLPGWESKMRSMPNAKVGPEILNQIPLAVKTSPTHKKVTNVNVLRKVQLR